LKIFTNKDEKIVGFSLYKRIEIVTCWSEKVKKKLPYSRRRSHSVNGWSLLVVSRKNRARVNGEKCCFSKYAWMVPPSFYVGRVVQFWFQTIKKVWAKHSNIKPLLICNLLGPITSFLTHAYARFIFKKKNNFLILLI
jgi:hypothetical protein